jgi:hypothetical protein
MEDDEAGWRVAEPTWRLSGIATAVFLERDRGNE